MVMVMECDGGTIPRVTKAAFAVIHDTFNSSSGVNSNSSAWNGGIGASVSLCDTLGISPVVNGMSDVEQ